MNESLKMYRMTEIVKHNLPVDLPNCMYKMKNIQSPTNSAGINGTHQRSAANILSITEKVKQFLKVNANLPEMTALQEKQEKILIQLKELKQQIYSLKGELGNSNQTKPAVVKCTFAPRTKSKCDVSKLPEIIINANPQSPPYSLKVIQNLLKDRVHLFVTSHTHSTVPAIPKSAEILANHLQNFEPRTDVQVKLRLVWKKIEGQTELIISNIPIIGEANILRYLARVLDGLNYEDSNRLDIDNVLDTSYCIVNAKTKTERTNLIQSINKKLGKGKWLCGSSDITIADIALYSAIKQVENEPNANLTKWMERCESV